MLSVSRRRIGVVLFRGRRPLGGWVAKAGQLLDATVLGRSLEPARAFEVLLEDPGTRFTVVEYPAPLEAERRLAGLGGLWSGEREPEVAEPPAVEVGEEVVAGSLHETPLFAVLMSLGLSRQHLVVEIRSGEVWLGAITLRSSQVLDVKHTSGDRGADALFRLLTAAVADRFRVLRLSDIDPNGFVPLGTLVEMLRSLRTRLAESGPRLVVPGETELREWLMAEPFGPEEDEETTPPGPGATVPDDRRLDALMGRVTSLQQVVVALLVGIVALVLVLLVLGLALVGTL